MSRSFLKARSKSLLAIAFCLALVIFFMALYGYVNTWKIWNIPVMSPPFADLRVITHGADSVSQGFDPLVKNPGDPWGRPLNYPKIWQVLYIFGLNNSHTIPLAILIIILFLWGVLLLLHRPAPIVLIVTSLGLLSPAVLLGIERGNIDLLMFFLLSLAVHLSRRSIVYADILLVVSSILKLYPIFALTLLIKLPKVTFIRNVLAIISVLSMYWLPRLRELGQISESTPRSIALSYGMNVAWMKLNDMHSSLAPVVRSFGAIVVYGLLMCILTVIITMILERNLSFTPGLVELDYFRVGAGIYIGTFILGNNFDYRLMFLLFCIPQVCLWITTPPFYLRLCSVLALSCIIISMWSLVITPLIGYICGKILSIYFCSADLLFFWGQLMHWVLFMTLALLLILTIPGRSQFISRSLAIKAILRLKGAAS